ncbi:hypothetical protein HAX54_029462, partial [Datura stramonium]|nr:hypothetical protein [Datura stramonium]
MFSFSRGLWDPRYLRVSPLPQWAQVGVIVIRDSRPVSKCDITPVKVLTIGK